MTPDSALFHYLEPNVATAHPNAVELQGIVSKINVKVEPEIL